MEDNSLSEVKTEYVRPDPDAVVEKPKPVIDPTKPHRICVCNGPACSAGFTREIKDKLTAHFASNQNITVANCGCTGHCSLANNILVDEDYVVSRNTPQNAVDKVERALAGDVYGAGGGVEIDPFNLEDDKFLGF